MQKGRALSRPAQKGVLGPANTRRGGAARGPLGADGAYRDGAKGAARAGNAPQPIGLPAVGPGRRNTYWLAVERGHPGSVPPVLGLADGRGVLPVFGFEEENGLFARLSRRGGRSVLRIGIGEIVSLLCGPLGGADLVALDALSDAEADVLDGSASLTRQGFLGFLLGPENSGGSGRSLAGLAPETRVGEACDAAGRRADVRRGGGEDCVRPWPWRSGGCGPVERVATGRAATGASRPDPNRIPAEAGLGPTWRA